MDQNYDDQQVLVDNPSQFDPKVANALATITRDRSHQIIAAQSKLDRRYKSLSAVAYLASAIVKLRTALLLNKRRGPKRGYKEDRFVARYIPIFSGKRSLTAAHQLH